MASYDPDDVTERHGATTPEGCRRLNKRFKEWGRNVDLVKVQPNSVGTGGVLNWECLFQGEDAEVGFSFNKRYNGGKPDSAD